MDILTALLISSSLLLLVLIVLLFALVFQKTSPSPERKRVREDLEKIKAQIEERAFV